jgi:TolA-binding protein
MEVVEGHKESEAVNDALERVLLIGENQGEELKEYAKAELLGIEGKYDAGIGLLRKIIGRSSSSPLAPRATFLMGDLLKGKGEVHQAIGAYQDIISNYPESPLCPYAKLQVGEIYASELRDKKKGIRELEGLLMEYPNSVLCELVRERIEELKGL